MSALHPIARDDSRSRLALFDGFSKKYRIHRLVWCETFSRIDDAIAFEKLNPGWNDLAAAG
jgi:predicted GIY-YIG superfamily endonuclease